MYRFGTKETRIIHARCRHRKNIRLLGISFHLLSFSEYLYDTPRITILYKSLIHIATSVIIDNDYVFLIVIIGGVFVVLSILRTEEEDDEYAKWGEEGYEDSLSATYGAVAAAPSVPTSMPTPEPTASPSVVQNITYNITDSAISGDLSATAPAAAPPQEAGMPPLPEEGLPQGWTMEQWKHYGQQWLEQNGRA